MIFNKRFRRCVKECNEEDKPQVVIKTFRSLIKISRRHLIFILCLLYGSNTIFKFSERFVIFRLLLPDNFCISGVSNPS